MKISIGVICFNHERFLSRCLDSLLGQTLKPHEIIIADDCSTDHSWALIQSYQAKYPGIVKGYQSDMNRGPFHTGALVNQHLSGDYVSLMDGDDFWFPEKIECELNAMLNQDAEIGHSDVTLVDHENNVLGTWMKRSEIQSSGDAFIHVMGRRFFKQSESVFRNELITRKAFDSDGWADGDLKNFWDWERKIRYAHKYRTAHTDKNLVVYRLHPQGISRMQSKEDIFSAMVHVFEKHRHLLGMRTPGENFYVSASFEISAAVQQEKLGLSIYPQYTYSNVFKRLNHLLYQMCSEEKIEMLQLFAYELFVVLANKLGKKDRIDLFTAIAGEINQVKSSIQKAHSYGC